MSTKVQRHGQHVRCGTALPSCATCPATHRGIAPRVDLWSNARLLSTTCARQGVNNSLQRIVILAECGNRIAMPGLKLQASADRALSIVGVSALWSTLAMMPRRRVRRAAHRLASGQRSLGKVAPTQAAREIDATMVCRDDRGASSRPCRPSASSSLFVARFRANAAADELENAEKRRYDAYPTRPLGT